MPAPMTAGEFGARLDRHVRTRGGLTSVEWMRVLKAPLLLAPERRAGRFRSTTFDIRAGRLVTSTTTETIHAG